MSAWGFNHLFLIVACTWTLCQCCGNETWACHDGMRCIQEKYTCDGIIHCRDGSDEQPEVCALWQCPDDMWRCANHKCIDVGKVCDGDSSASNGNCGDGDDEREELCTTWQCRKDRWKCPSNKCIAAEKVCDRNADCSDGADMFAPMCEQWNCTEGYWQCDDNVTCIPEAKLCDGNFPKDCPDGSDENYCKDIDCPEGRWKCSQVKDLFFLGVPSFKLNLNATTRQANFVRN